MRQIKNYLSQEIAYFRTLPHEAQKLLYSYSLSAITDPILYTFLNAFLWRSGHSLQLVAWYNLAFFIGLPFAFYANGYLIRRWQPNRLYLFGCLAEGTIISLLFFFDRISYPSLFVFGFCFGLAAGLYWANRNLLSLRSTSAQNRIYFSSLENALSTPISILMPALVGWFIGIAPSTHWYTSTVAYQALALISIGVLFLVGLVAKEVTIELTTVKKIIVMKASFHWQVVRLFTLIDGLMSGISIFLPTMMVLTLVGKEGALGTVQSGATLLSAFVIYYVGKLTKVENRSSLLWSSFLLYFFASLSFGILYSAVGTIIFFALTAMQAPFSWSGIASISQDSIDTEEKESDYNHYSYIFDQELFLNIGRIMGIAIFFFLTNTFSSQYAIRFSPLIFSSTLLVLILLGHIIDKKNKKVHLELSAFKGTREETEFLPNNS